MRVGVPAVVTQDARAVDEADAVVLPGDGAFHDAMASLERLGLLEPLRRALDGRRPFLGICLGYQLLFSESEEFGDGRGLDVIPGVVRRFPARAQGAAHGVEPRRSTAARCGSSRASRAARTSTSCTRTIRCSGAWDSGRDVVADRSDRGSVRWGWCEYGVRFAAAVETGRIYATQFHPEKSQSWASGCSRTSRRS